MLFKSILAASLAATAMAAPALLPDIVGGKPVEPFKYTWMASLQRNGSHFCGGSVVAPGVLVTAAHCSESRIVGNYSNIRVQAHRHDLNKSVASEDGIEYRVTKVIPHPKYSSRTTAYDYAVWYLTPVNKSEAEEEALVTKIALDDGSTDASAAGTELTTIGWGTTSSGGSVSKILLGVNVPAVSDADCTTAYGTNYQASNMICAGFKEGGKDACQGDSGGPLFKETGNQAVLVGLTSWGYGCARPNYYGVYARVSSEIEWLRSQIDARATFDDLD